MVVNPLDEIRAKYNIGPSYSPKREDDIHGIEKIKVELVDYPENPYRAIFEVVTSTWGSRNSWWNRWENTPVEGRIFVVISALSRNTLPQALESISFTWKIQGLSRSAYDQLARHRHTAIGSVGMRDNCLLPGTLVRTVTGFKPIEKIKEGDLVLTHKGRFRRVKKVLKRYYKGKILKIIPCGYPDGVYITPEHPILIIPREKIRRDPITGRMTLNINLAEWRRAYQVKKLDYWVEALEVYPQKVTSIDLSRYPNVSYIANQHGVTKRIHPRLKTGKTLQSVDLVFELGLLIGWYLAEGCLLKSGKGNINGIYLAIGKKDIERGYINELKRAIEKIAPGTLVKIVRKEIKSPVKLPSGKVLENPQPIYGVKIFHRQLANWIFEEFGEGCTKKKIPNWVLYAPEEFKRGLLIGWIKGDGIIREKSSKSQITIEIAGGSVNKEMILQLERIATSMKLPTLFKTISKTLSKNPNYVLAITNVDENLKYSDKSKVRMRVDNNYRFRCIKFIEEHEYEGYVYNLEVEEDESYTLICGTVHNCWLDAALVLPRDLLEDEKLLEEIKKWWKYTKNLYEKIVKKGQHSWQSARFILPMGVEWRFTWTMNYRAFQELAAARLKFCEQFDTVATVWMMWKTLWDKFPLLAAYVRPGCDWAGVCQYYKMYSLSSLFGSLFKPCGRHPIVEDRKYKDQLKVLFPEVYRKWEEQIRVQNIYASWNMAAADPKEIEEKLNIRIPKPEEWNNLVEEAIKRDRKFFEE